MITTDAKTLRNALSLLSSCAERKGTIPILSHALIEHAEDGRIRLTATDLDTFISLMVSAQNDSFLSFCVPLSELLTLTRLLDGEITLSPSQGRVAVKSGSSLHKLPLREGKDFPSPERVEGTSFEIAGQTLHEMIRLVSPSMETHPDGDNKWKSVNLRIKDGKMALAATDQGQLGVATCAVGADDADITLGAVSVPSLLAFTDCDTLIEVMPSASHLRLETDGRVFVSRLLDAKFPNYEMIIPANFDHSVSLSRDVLLPTLKRAALRVDREFASMDWIVGNGQLEVKTESPESNATEIVPIDCESLNGDLMEIRVKGSNILKFLALAEGDVLFEFNSPEKPVRLTYGAPVDFQFITMPLRDRKK